MMLKKEQLLLYAVTDRAWVAPERSLLDDLEDALKGGVTMVQLREKDLSEEAFEAEAVQVLALCRRYGVPLLINDNAALAVKIGADGAHVGQSDLQAEEARRLLGPDKILGVTAKTVEQAKAAQAAGADYLGSGAVFGTTTKKDAKPMDMALLKEITGSVQIPVVAIGGIHAGNAAKLAGSGIAGAAVVSGIFAKPDKKQAAEDLVGILKTFC
ncbi:MAG: thiamine phosphate synthase [Firmicutes bacterium]|nr:thiamine phosphate synthase [Bacillota bacterium]